MIYQGGKEDPFDYDSADTIYDVSGGNFDDAFSVGQDKADYEWGQRAQELRMKYFGY